MTIEQYYDNLYERAESVNENECPECEGTGIEYYSDCCGAVVSSIGKCTACHCDCETVSGVCEECNGEGVE